MRKQTKCPMPSKKKRKSTATATPASGAAHSGNVHDERIHSQWGYWYWCRGPTKGQVKYRGMVSVATGCGRWWHFSDWGGENVQHHHTLCPLAALLGAPGVQGTHSLRHWIILACREDWPNEGDLPGHMGPWKSIEEVQQILWDQSIPLFVKALIGPRPLQEWKSLPAPGMGHWYPC